MHHTVTENSALVLMEVIKNLKAVPLQAVAHVTECSFKQQLNPSTLKTKCQIEKTWFSFFPLAHQFNMNFFYREHHSIMPVLPAGKSGIV